MVQVGPSADDCEPILGRVPLPTMPIAASCPRLFLARDTMSSVTQSVTRQNKSMPQHVLLILLLLYAFAMNELTAAQSCNLIGNSSQPRVARHGPAKNDNAVKFRQLVDRQAQAWEKHNFAIAASDWLPGAELISPAGHTPATQMQTAMTGYFKQFRDLRVTVKNVFVSSDGAKAAIEWDWDVTRQRDGTRAVTHDAIIIDLVGGKIASWREYFDFGNSVDANP